MRVGRGPVLPVVRLLLAGTTAVAQSSWRLLTGGAHRGPRACSVHFTAAGDFGSSAQTSTLFNGIRARVGLHPRARRPLVW